jgi:hypothetical protein
MAADDPQWLVIARELRAIAQTGLTFTADRFDRQRYDRVRELAASMLAQGSGADYGAILGVLLKDRGYATPKVDVRGAAFFPRDALPPLSLGRTTAAQIDRMFHHAEHPDTPTDFD